MLFVHGFQSSFLTLSIGFLFSIPLPKANDGTGVAVHVSVRAVFNHPWIKWSNAGVFVRLHLIRYCTVPIPPLPPRKPIRTLFPKRSVSESTGRHA